MQTLNEILDKVKKRGPESAIAVELSDNSAFVVHANPLMMISTVLCGYIIKDTSSITEEKLEELADAEFQLRVANLLKTDGEEDFKKYIQQYIFDEDDYIDYTIESNAVDIDGKLFFIGVVNPDEIDKPVDETFESLYAKATNEAIIDIVENLILKTNRRLLQKAPCLATLTRTKLIRSYMYIFDFETIDNAISFIKNKVEEV